MRLHYYQYSLRNGRQKVKTKVAVAISIFGLAIGGGTGMSLAFFGTSHAAPPTVIYNNIPSPMPGNVVSEAYEATSTSEFGGQVNFAGSTRTNPTVTVLMSSWGCQSGGWEFDNCSTTPGSTFSEPITLNIYNVGANNTLGSLVTKSTQTFNIPYRPSADNTNCTGANLGKWYSATDQTCYNGLATPISFNMAGTLPDTAIVTLAYNTSDFGANPYGDSTTCHSTSGGCGYDSLNVGVVNTAPTVGNYSAPNSDYLNSSSSSAYCDNGANGTGTLRYDSGDTETPGQNDACPYQPAIEVTTAAVAPTLVGSVTGGLTLTNPRQQISFNAFDYGPNSSSDYGTVEYQNFDYPGGLHYTANVQCVTVSGNSARFVFQIPAGNPLAGEYVEVAVRDNGSPAKSHDFYGHTATSSETDAMSWCETGSSSAVTQYTITGGNLVVHKS